MSLMSQSSGPIAPESRRLLREARRMQRAGFKEAAGALAGASAEQKLKEPNIASSENRMYARQLESALQGSQMAQENKDQQAGLEGRIGYAQSILERAKNPTPGENLYEKTLTEAPKFGVSPAQLAGFFKRKGLSYGSTPKTI